MSENNHFITGLLIGSVAAGLGTLLMAPKSGKELINDLSDTYNDVTDKACDLTDEIKHKSWHLIHPNETCDVCEGSSPTHFAAGALAGAALGVASAFFLAKKPGKNLRRDIEKTYNNVMEQGEEWKETISDVLHKLQNVNGSKSKHSSHLDNILNLANAGFHIWSNLQKRK